MKLIFVFLTTFLALLIQAAGDVKYGLLGGEVILFPSAFSGKLTRVLWKHGDDKAVEWDIENNEVEAYREFKGRTFLDKENGNMKITKLTEPDSGFYSAEINGVQKNDKTELKVIGRVSKPKTQTNCSDSVCTLTCVGEVTTEGKYAWRVVGGKSEPSESGVLEVKKSDEVIGKAYTCQYSNPLSEEESEPVTPYPNPGPSVGLIIGILIAIGGGVGAATFAFVKREELKGLFTNPRSPMSKEGTSTNKQQDVEATPDAETPLTVYSSVGEAADNSEVPAGQ